MNTSYRKIVWAFLVVFSAITQNSVDTTPCPAGDPVTPECVDCTKVTSGSEEEMDCFCNGIGGGTCVFCEDNKSVTCLNCTNNPDNPACVKRCTDNPSATGCPTTDSPTTKTTASSATTESSSTSNTTPGQNRKKVHVSKLKFQVKRRLGKKKGSGRR